MVPPPTAFIENAGIAGVDGGPRARGAGVTPRHTGHARHCGIPQRDGSVRAGRPCAKIERSRALPRAEESQMAVQTAEQHAQTAIVGRMDFCPPGEKVIFYPTDRAKSQWPYRPHEVKIADARAVKDELSFEGNGFVLVEREPVVD